MTSIVGSSKLSVTRPLNRLNMKTTWKVTLFWSTLPEISEEEGRVLGTEEGNKRILHQQPTKGDLERDVGIASHQDPLSSIVVRDWGVKREWSSTTCKTSGSQKDFYFCLFFNPTP